MFDDHRHAWRVVEVELPRTVQLACRCGCVVRVVRTRYFHSSIELVQEGSAYFGPASDSDGGLVKAADRALLKALLG